MIDFGRGLRRVVTWVVLACVALGLMAYDVLQWFCGTDVDD